MGMISCGARGFMLDVERHGVHRITSCRVVDVELSPARQSSLERARRARPYLPQIRLPRLKVPLRVPNHQLKVDVRHEVHLSFDGPGRRLGAILEVEHDAIRTGGLVQVAQNDVVVVAVSRLREEEMSEVGRGMGGGGRTPAFPGSGPN